MNNNANNPVKDDLDLDEILAEVRARKAATPDADAGAAPSKLWSVEDIDRLLADTGGTPPPTPALPADEGGTAAERTRVFAFPSAQEEPPARAPERVAAPEPPRVITPAPEPPEPVRTEDPPVPAEESGASPFSGFFGPPYPCEKSAGDAAVTPAPDPSPQAEVPAPPVQKEEAEQKTKVVPLPERPREPEPAFSPALTRTAPSPLSGYRGGMESDAVRERFMHILELERTAEHDLPGRYDPIEKPGVVLEKGQQSRTGDLEPMPTVIPAEEVLRAAEQKTTVNAAAPAGATGPAASIPDGQIILTGFGTEDQGPAYVEETAVESELLTRRKEKVKTFVVRGIPEEDEEPVPRKTIDFESFDSIRKIGPEDEEDAEKAPVSGKRRLEYRFPEQRNRIMASIENARAKTGLSALVLAIIQLGFLLQLALPRLLEAASIETDALSVAGTGYFLSSFLLLAVAAFFCVPCLKSGYKALFRLRPNCDTAAALAVTLAAIHNIVVIVVPAVREQAMLYSAAAAFALLLNTLGRRFGHTCARDNFAFCAFTAPDSLYSVQEIENSNEAFELGRGILMGNPTVLYSRKAGFPADFIENARNVGIAEGINTWLLPAASGLALIAGLVAWGTSKSAVVGYSVFTGAMCLGVPACALLLTNLPLRAANKALNADGAMIANWDAAGDCARSNAVVIDSADLFDRSNCSMHGFKEYGNVRTDDIVLYTAAMFIKSGGPLADVFEQSVVNGRDLLPPVKSLSYEDRLGLTAWIHGHKVLLGTRSLLTHHSIDVPAKTEEDKYKHDGRRVIYLAVGGKVAALFVVSYAPDKTLLPYIKSLADKDIQLLVRTCDPNIGEELIAECFDLPVNTVKVLSATAGRIFKRYRDKVRETAPARVLHEGSAFSLLKCVNAAVAVCTGVHAAALLQAVCLGVGLVGMTVLAGLSLFSAIGALQVILFQAFTAVLCLAAGMFRRVR